MTSGQRSFTLEYHTKGGRKRRLTIGAFPAWGTAAARAEAAELRRRIDRGEDPLGEAEALRGAPTVADLATRYEEVHLSTLRPQSAKEQRAALRRDVLPALRHLKVSEVALEDVDAVHRAITRRGSPYQANRTRALLHKMFRYSVEWQWRTDNPVTQVRKNREHPRQRYLTSDEIARLSAALAADEDQDAADIFRLCLLTGCRRGEARSVRWADIDFEHGVWTKPARSTKQGKEHRAPLAPPALSLLAERRRRAESSAVFVFPGDGATGHRWDLKKPWQRISKAAGIAKTEGVEGVRIHDLRHTFASIAASAGHSLPVIGALLGHADPSTTARYSHLLDEALRAAVNRVGATVEGVVPNGGGSAPGPRGRE
jgi:integrase